MTRPAGGVRSSNDARPLAGIRVLDVGTLTPGKYCTYVLADLGADVIRVERPGAATRSVDDEDLILNQGKRSVTLNLRTDTGKGLFLQLAADADIILEGNRPGTADRHGVGYQAVKQDNERIIYCALSGFGATGPMSQDAGYDLVFLGLSGLLQALTGNVGPPALPHAYLADGISGLSAAYAVAVALFTRERTGVGAFIDLAMLDSTFAMLAVSHGVRKKGVRKDHDALLAESAVDAESAEATSPFYDVYAAAEGTYLVLGAIRKPSRDALFARLGRPDLAATTGAGETRSFLQQAFRAKRAHEWVAELAPLDIEIARVNRPDEAFDDPQLRRRGMIGATNHPDAGEFEFIRPALNPFFSDPRRPSSSDERRPPTPAPRIGEHTEEVLKSLGVVQSRLSALREDGII